jgi:DHA1 family tetracycline resistance protein-like MFS transporter
VGLSTALVQGGVVRRLLPRLGERRAIVLGGLIGAGTYVLYGLATRGWMIYAILVVNAFSGFLPPAIQGLMSRAVPADEQGMLQGGLASVNSVCNILGPLLSTNLFGYFISSAAPVYLPGAFFFVGAALILVGLGLAMRTFPRIPASPAVAASVPAPSG